MSDHSTYQIGAGVPLNQQYLQSQNDTSTTISSQQAHQQQHPQGFAGAPAPPAYDPHAPDIPPTAGQYQPYRPPPEYEIQGHAQNAQQDKNEKSNENPVQPSIPLPTGQSHTHGGAGINQAVGTVTPRTEGPDPARYFPPPPVEVPNQQYPPPASYPSTDQSEHTHNTAPTNSVGHTLTQEYPQPLKAHYEYTAGNQQIPDTVVSGALEYRPPLPPRTSIEHSAAIDPIHYTRDPHRLTAYLIPFPKPRLKHSLEAAIPDRFLIYTPPAPPIPKPAEGTNEPRLQKIQRKWQEEVRAAKTSTAKTASWKGVKSKATRGINKAVGLTTSANLDFLNRIPDSKDRSSRQSSPDRRHEDDGVYEDVDTHKTVGLQDLVLVYPASYNATPEQAKTEFINTMMRSKSKAQRDSIVATGLLPVSAAIDILATPIWPFGGLLEVDGVWAYSSIRGAKTARSVTKRLTSSTKTGYAHGGDEDQDQLHLQFLQDSRMEVLYRYLCSKCTARNPHLFPSKGTATTETEVLEAIGWSPSQTGGEKNWEDEQWEISEVKDDLKMVMGKGAREWDKWCKHFAEDPDKALKK